MHAPYQQPQRLKKTFTFEDLKRTRQLYLLEARDYFAAYRKLIRPNMLWGWWVDELSWHLQDFYEDLIADKRPILAICSPPQHGKSWMVTDFVSWLAGKNPDLKTIFASFSDDLGARTNRDVRRAIQSEVFPTIFPDTKIEEDGWICTNNLVEYCRNAGSFRNTTVEGKINGMELHLGIIDDPFKDRATAKSPSARNKIWDWYTDVWRTRFNKTAGQLVVQTRWDLDDLLGRMINKEGHRVKLVSYPAIAEHNERYRKKGEALFPELKPLDYLEAQRGIMTEGSWLSEYQQTPIVVGGGMIPIDKLRIIGNWSPEMVKASVRYIDRAATEGGSGSWTAGVLMHALNDGRYLIGHVFRGHWNVHDREYHTRHWVEQDASIYKNYQVWIEQEPGSGGKESVEATIRNLAGFSAFADKVTGAKEVRAEPFAAQVQGNNVFLLSGTWVKDFLTEAECVDKATEIVTMQGIRPIISVHAGNMVMTRKGWRRVLRAGCTGQNRLCQITLSNGRQLRTTLNHPIFIPGYGFKKAGTLKVGELLLQYTGGSCLRYGTEFYTFAQVWGLMENACSCIVLYMSRKLDRFRKGMRSIIKTAIRQITSWTTSNVYRLICTGESPTPANMSIPVPFAEQYFLEQSQKLNTVRINAPMKDMATAAARRYGDAVWSAKNGFGFLSINIALSTAVFHALRRHIGSMVRPNISASNQNDVNGAGMNLSRTKKDNDFVAKVAVRSINMLEGMHDVYNLSVEDAPEYVANGVLVHNSWPEGRWNDQIDAAGGAFAALTKITNFNTDYSQWG